MPPAKPQEQALYLALSSFTNKQSLSTPLTVIGVCCCPKVQAWTFINAKAQPLLTTVPALHRYIGFVKRWFDQPMAQQQARSR